MQMLKKALIAYVNSIKSVWSAVAHPLSIVSKRKGNVKDYRIYGNSVQDGTPTPENPIEVQSVGELTKNLFNKDNFDRYKAYINVKDQKWYMVTDSSSLTLKCKPNTTYTISHSYDSVPIFRCCYIIAEDSNKINTTPYNFNAYNAVQSDSLSVKALTLTTGEDATYLVVQFSNALFDEVIATLQIEEGSTATEYEPYHKYKVPVTVRGKNILETYTVSKGYWLDSSGGSSTGGTGLLRVSNIPVEPNTQYTISSNVALYTIWYARSTDNSDTITRINAYGLFKKTFTTPEECKYIRVSLDLKTTNQEEEGESAVEWIMLEKGEGNGAYEPYTKPRTVNIYLDEPLGKGDVIQKSVDGLPNLPQLKGTTIYEVNQDVAPSGIEVCYYE